MVYIVDTHSLIWFLTEDTQLSPKAKKVLENEDTEVIIPSIVLAEIKYLHHKRRITLSLDEINTRL